MDIESHVNSIMGSIMRLPSPWLFSTVLLNNMVNKSREIAGSISHLWHNQKSPPPATSFSMTISCPSVHKAPSAYGSTRLPMKLKSAVEVQCLWCCVLMNAWMTARPGRSYCKFTLVHMESSQALNRFTAGFNRHLNDIQTLVPKPPQWVLAVCCSAEICTLLQVLLKAALCMSFCHPGPPLSPWRQQAHSQQKVFLKGSD